MGELESGKSGKWRANGTPDFPERQISSRVLSFSIQLSAAVLLCFASFYFGFWHSGVLVLALFVVIVPLNCIFH